MNRYSKEQPLRIAIAEDHFMFRKGFVALLNIFENTKVIFEAENGQHLLYLLKSEQPDILFLDIKMPVMNGIEACIRAHEEYPKMHIIVLTEYDDAKNILGMVNAGANGFLLKNVETAELQLAIHSVLENGFYFCSKAETELKRKRIGELVSDIKLDTFELNLLKLLCEDHKTGVIATELNRSVRTTERLIDDLRTKINAKSRTGMVVYAMRNGYYK